MQASTAPGQLVEYVWQDVHKWLVEAEEQPQYCVFLLNSGLAQEGLAAAEAAAVATDMPLPSIVSAEAFGLPILVGMAGWVVPCSVLQYEARRPLGCVLAGCTCVPPGA